MNWPWTRKKKNSVQTISKKLNTMIQAEQEKQTARKKRLRNRRIQNAEQRAQRRLEEFEILEYENVDYAKKRHPELLQKYGLRGLGMQGLPFQTWMEFQKELQTLRKQNKEEERLKNLEYEAESERLFQERLRLNREMENNPVPPSYGYSRPVTPSSEPRLSMGGKRTRKQKQKQNQKRKH